MDALAPIFDVLSSIATVIMPAINFILYPILEIFQALGSSIQHIKDMFTGDLEPSFNNILGTALKLGGAITGIVVLLKAYKAIQAGIAMQKRLSLIMEAQGSAMTKREAIMSIIGGAWKSSGVIPVVGAVLAAAAIAGGIALLNSKSSTANDMFSPGQGSSGYGKRTLMGPEGAIQLNNKDTVIAGTNLFGDDVKSEPGKSTQMAGEGEIKAGGASVDMTQTNALLQQNSNQLLQQEVSVTLDGQKVGEAT
jgi:hypothetical protein